MNQEVYNTLIKTNYFIKYNYIGENRAELTISWLNKSVVFSYDKKLKSIVRDDDKKFKFKCPEYIAGIIINILVRRQCENLKYGYDMLILENYKNKSVNFFFGDLKDNEQNQKAILLNEIYVDIIKTGLTREHVECAIEYDIMDGLSLVCILCLGISINAIK